MATWVDAVGAAVLVLGAGGVTYWDHRRKRFKGPPPRELEPLGDPAGSGGSSDDTARLEAIVAQAAAEQLAAEQLHPFAFDAHMRIVAAHQRAERLAMIAGVGLPCSSEDHDREHLRYRCSLHERLKGACT